MAHRAPHAGAAAPASMGNFSVQCSFFILFYKH
jgi:hypothetical protein